MSPVKSKFTLNHTSIILKFQKVHKSSNFVRYVLQTQVFHNFLTVQETIPNNLQVTVE